MEGLVSKRAAIRIPFSEDGFVSIVFVIAKGSGGFRPVINLKKSNVYIKYEKFKMEGLQSLRHLVRPNDWMPKIELKDAYLRVSKVSTVCLGREILPRHGNAFWSVISPEDIHQVDETVNRVFAA